MRFLLESLRAAAEIVYRQVPATPQYVWPLLSGHAGLTVWVKHENHTQTGAFKVRGGVLYMHHLKQRQPDCPGVIAATRGNHGQSIAVSATHQGLRSVICVPEGNNPEKNAAMIAQGAELVHTRPRFPGVPGARPAACGRRRSAHGGRLRPDPGDGCRILCAGVVRGRGTA